MVLFWSARAQRAATACVLEPKKMQVPDQVRDDVRSTDLGLELEQMIFAVEPGLADGAFGGQRFGGGAAFGLEDDQIARAPAFRIMQHAGGLNREVGLLEEAADLLLQRRVDRIGGFEEAHPHEQHRLVSLRSDSKHRSPRSRK